MNVHFLSGSVVLGGGGGGGGLKNNGEPFAL